jgi:hypothetical protein
VVLVALGLLGFALAVAVLIRLHAQVSRLPSGPTGRPTDATAAGG